MADQMKTVKITPAWTGIAPVIAELLRSNDNEARDYAYGELLRLCEFADKMETDMRYTRKQLTLPPAFIEAVLESDFASVARWIVAETAANRSCKGRSDKALQLMSIIQTGMYAEVEDTEQD